MNEASMGQFVSTSVFDLNLRVEKAFSRDWQNTVMNLQCESGKSNPLELVVQEVVGELELEDDVEQVEDFANIELAF